MRLPSWLRPRATHLNPICKRTARPRRNFRPRVERLEDRLAPAILTINSTGDTVSGSTSTLDLREAILLVNSGGTATDSSGISLAAAKTAQISGTFGVADTINFNIPANDPGHVYYRDDGVSNQLTMANVTQTAATSDLSIADIDFDYEHSWWTIRPLTALPAITRPVLIDGFSQPGASAGPGGTNPLWRMELDGSSAGTGVDGLTIAGGSSTVQGLVINRFVGASSIGIEVTGAGSNIIQGNYIGTDISGTRLAGNAVANNLDPTVMHVGINVDGTSDHNLIGAETNAPHDANVVCGTCAGIGLTGPGVANRTVGGSNVVSGNFVGIGGSYYGYPGTYSNNGVTQLMGNAIGVSTDLYAHDDLIGAGPPTSNLPYVENMISGNLVAGVVLGGGGTQIAGEYGGEIAGNTITHNGHAGIVVDIDSQNCSIESNEIAFNGVIGGTQIANAPGIWIFNLLGRGTPTGISVLSNSIHDNTGLGIDLGGSAPPPPYALDTPNINPDGPTANDSPDQATGPNHYQNYPVLISATAGNGTAITGTFHSTPNGTFRLQFFDNTGNNGNPDPVHTYPGDPNVYGEGQTLIGEAEVTTDAAGNLATSPDGSVNISYDAANNQYTFTTTGALHSGTNITATATNLDTYDTSEFSPELQLPFALGDGYPYTGVSEGQSVTFHANILQDPNNEPLTVSWGFAKVNADGTAGPPVFGGITGANPTVTWAQLVALGINDGPSSWLVTMKASDNQGNVYVISRNTTLIVGNTPPTASVSGPTAAIAGQVLSFTLGASDPSPIDQADGFTYSVDWGDGASGSPDVQTFAASAGNGAGLTVTHAYTSAGTYTALVTATDKDGGVSTAVSTAVQVNAVTAGNLQQQLTPGSTLTVQTATPQQAHDIIAAANSLDPATTPTSTLVVDLGGQTIQDTTVNVPPQVTVQFVNGTFIGGSPALIVSSGVVIVRNSVFQNATDAPTILVTGGSLILRGDTIQESTGYSDAAIEVTSGTVDLGTTTDPGGNTLNINGGGSFIQNTTSIPVTSAGNAFQVNGVALTPDSLSGIVFEDFNDDGQVDFGEQGISGVAVTLTGTDFLGNAVSMSATTDSDGAYIFANLQPGAYSITQTQPAGYNQGINTVGTAGGSLTATDTFLVSLAQNAIGLNGLNYNFGEQPQASGGVHQGQTAGIGYWNNKNGQALIESFNGGASSTQLSAWLAATLPHIFGVDAGGNALIHADGSSFTNAEVAARFQQDFVLKGVKLDAQVLATALSVYATNATLDDTGVAANYGFLVSGDGVGTAGVNVGSNGDAFGVANNTALTVLDLLKATDALAVNGLLYNGDVTLRKEANNVYSAINEQGDIG